MPLAYALWEADGGKVDVQVEYRQSDAGGTFVRAHQAGSTEFEGTEQRATASSDGGVRHAFLWNATLDLPGEAQAVVDVRVTRELPGASAESAVATSLALSLTHRCQVDLNAPTSVLSTSGGMQVVAEDFDGDGKPDLVTIDEEGTVAMVRGRGDGQFEPSVTLLASSFMTSIAVGDFNEDGRLDVAAVGAGKLLLLLNSGDGGFVATQPIVAIGYRSTLAVGDINGDGHLDLIATDPDETALNVVLGNGDGTLRPAVLTPTVENPLQVLLADINGDGKLDLILSTGGLGGVSAMLGRGDGTFLTPSVYSVSSITRLAVADLNGDGALDLVAADGNSGDTSVLLNDGRGTFGPEQRFPVGRAANDLAVTDLDGDGHLDVIIANGDDYLGTGQALTVLLGTGDGSLGPAQAVIAGPMAAGFLATGDFDSDGRADVAMSSLATFWLSVAFGDGQGTFRSSRSDAVDGGNNFSQPILLTGEVNGDARSDLLLLDLSNGQVSPLLGSGDGSFVAVAPVATNFHVPPAIRDFDGDGLMDMVGIEANQVVWYRSLGDGGFGPGTALGDAGQPSQLTLGRLTSSGFLDAVVGSQNALNVFLGTGAGGVAPPVVTDTTPLFPEALAVGDIDGDGYGDVVVLDATSVYVFRGAGDGTLHLSFQGAGLLAFAYFGTVSVGDVNGDGRDDVLLAYGGQAAQVFLGQADGTLSEPVNLDIHEGSAFAELVDANGDGHPDVIALGTRTNAAYIFLGNGDGSFGLPQTFFIGLNAGEYNEGTTNFVTGTFSGRGCLDFATAGVPVQGNLAVSVTLCR